MFGTVFKRLEDLEGRGSTMTSLGVRPDSASQRRGSEPSSRSGVHETPVSESGLGDTSVSETSARGGSDVRNNFEGGDGRAQGGAGAPSEWAAAEVAAHLGWPMPEPMAALLERALTDGVPIPTFGEESVRARLDVLDGATEAVRDLEQQLRVDTVKVAHASLFLDPIAKIRREEEFERVVSEDGLAFAYAYREWARAAGRGSLITERELLKLIRSEGGSVPKRWMARRSDDLTADLTACSTAAAEKAPKSFVETQRLLRDMVRGISDALEEVARAPSGEEALVHAVVTLRRLQGLVAHQAVANAEAYLSVVLDVSAEGYKPEARAKVDKALTEDERRLLDKRGELKVQIDTATTHKQMLHFFSAPKAAVPMNLSHAGQGSP